MNILVLNCGSSSVKYKLIEIKANKTLAEGGIEKIGLPDAFIKFKLADGSKKIIPLDITDHNGAIKAILDLLTSADHGCIKSFDEIDAVGHRVVHGGEKFNKSVLITDEVIAKVKECYAIAPLHNPVNIAGIEAITAVLPNVPQVGVFDTAFHQTMPAKAYMYALPYKYYKEDGVRRYGFHGTSHRYIAQRLELFLGTSIQDKKVVTCHIGNGGSLCAIMGGKCVDTTMGLTPLEGLMMGTRCGDIDPAIIPYLMRHEQLTADDIDTMMNKKSGLLGISGTTSDMREIQSARDQGDRRAALAQDMYYYRVRKYIGAMAAAMGGLDILVFAGGVGENKYDCREAACKGLEFMGVDLDVEKNKSVFGTEEIISKFGSRVTVCVVPTDEELMIAMDTDELTK